MYEAEGIEKALVYLEYRIKALRHKISMGELTKKETTEEMNSLRKEYQDLLGTKNE